MNVLRPGDPCPCCGSPIPADVPEETLMLLCFVARMKESVETTQKWEEDSFAE